MTEALIALVIIEGLAVLVLSWVLQEATAQRDKARRVLNKLLISLARRADGVNWTEGSGNL